MTQSVSGARNTAGIAVEVPPTNFVRSPGFCLADYEPLANLLPPVPTSPEVLSTPWKKRTVMNRSGKTMKEAYFKGIQRTRNFVTGSIGTGTQQA